MTSKSDGGPCHVHIAGCYTVPNLFIYFYHSHREEDIENSFLIPLELFNLFKFLFTALDAPSLEEKKR